MVAVWRMAWLGLLGILVACTPVYYTPTELRLSDRYGLIVLDAVELSRARDGEWEMVEFAFLASSPYAFSSLGEVGQGFRRQLEARGFTMRCETLNDLPIFGGPQYTLRMARGGEGVGLFLRPLSRPGAYRLEVGPASPNPPLDCPAR